jgi:hypothetical protein
VLLVNYPCYYFLIGSVSEGKLSVINVMSSFKEFILVVQIKIHK